MQRITFKDSGPKFLFSPGGELKLLRTGSDTFEGQKTHLIFWSRGCVRSTKQGFRRPR